MSGHVRWSDARRRHLEERTGTGQLCAHCQRVQAGYGMVTVKDASGTIRDQPLCHPDQGLDCYRLVTIYRHPMPCGCRGPSDHPDQDVCDDCDYRRFEHVVDVPDDERRYDFLGRPVPCLNFQPKARPTQRRSPAVGESPAAPPDDSIRVPFR